MDETQAETAWAEFSAVKPRGEEVSYSIKDTFLAGFDAASGPWAEHLDADELCEMPHPSHPEWLCERTKGHDAHRRPGDVWRTDEEAWVTMQADLAAALARNAELERERDQAVAEKGHAQAGVTAAEMLDASWKEACAERDSLRAELDNLRDRVNALADEWDERAEARRTHKTHREWVGDYGERLSGYVSDNPRNDAEGSVFDTCANRLRAAIVRGSDDAGEGA